MPLSMAFSGSRVSLNEIPADEDVRRAGVVADGSRKKGAVDPAGTGDGAREKVEEEEEISNEERMGKTKQATLRKGSSVESEESQTRSRRATMRRGSSADSALLLHIDPAEEDADKDSEGNKSLKKAVSMELPNRSPSPGAAKLSQEEYALKLELMRQRLLRGGNVDKKMSGLRGPLFETLGMEDERQTRSLDRNLRRSRAAQSSLTRAASSESPGEDTPQTKVFRKSVSFTQGDSEPMPLHRRFGAPLEIPSAGGAGTDGRSLQEATSMSALTEQTALESTSASPRDKNFFVFPTPANLDQQQKQNNVKRHGGVDAITEKRTKAQLENGDKAESGRSPSVITPIIVIEEDDEGSRGSQELCSREETPQNHKQSFAHVTVAERTQTPNMGQAKAKDASSSPEHPAVFAKIATADPPAAPRRPVLRTDIKDIDSEEVFEARFKKRESSLTRGLRKLTRNKSEERSPVLSRRAEGDEDVYRPGPRGAPIEMVSKGLLEKSKSVQDLREVDRDTGLGLMGRLSFRGRRSASAEKKGEKPKEEKQPKVQEGAASKRVSWATGRSKSLDAKDLDGSGAHRHLDEREQRKAEESSVSAMRRKFESKVAGISAKMRSQSEERKAKDTAGSQKDLVQKDSQKVSDSPVLAMRQKFENKVAGISSRIRSQSEERKGDADDKRTPLFARHRHSQSEGRGLKGMGIPENQLAKQTGASASKESIESASSVQSERASDSERRSRWDRWGLTRGKKEKTSSQADLPATAPKEEASTEGQQFARTASDFAPVFHIKLRDTVLLEGDPVTLTCLPAGSPHPEITWLKGRFLLETAARMFETPTLFGAAR